MSIPRVIPALLIEKEKLVKGIRFKNHTYVGDPLNAVRIFNEKEVDELMVLDISASNRNMPPDLEFVQQIADECYMPFAVGGGIRTIRHIEALLHRGAEKVVLGTAAIESPELIDKASREFGSQSIIVSVDIVRRPDGFPEVWSHSGSRETGIDACSWSYECQQRGAGELLINSIDRDGTGLGYDTASLSMIAARASIPVIALGGAGALEHLSEAVSNGHASAVAAGSLFVFLGSNRAVMINYPDKEELEELDW